MHFIAMCINICFRQDYVELIVLKERKNLIMKQKTVSLATSSFHKCFECYVILQNYYEHLHFEFFHKHFTKCY